MWQRGHSPGSRFGAFVAVNLQLAVGWQERKERRTHCARTCGFGSHVRYACQNGVFTGIEESGCQGKATFLLHHAKQCDTNLFLSADILFVAFYMTRRTFDKKFIQNNEYDSIKECTRRSRVTETLAVAFEREHRVMVIFAVLGLLCRLLPSVDCRSVAF